MDTTLDVIDTEPEEREVRAPHGIKFSQVQYQGSEFVTVQMVYELQGVVKYSDRVTIKEGRIDNPGRIREIKRQLLIRWNVLKQLGGQ